MKRVLTATILGAVLLTGAACGTEATPTAATASAAATSAAATSAAPRPSADYTADTKKVCNEVGKILDGDYDRFAEELGKMVTYQEAGDTAQAAKARASAQSQLTSIADGIREKTAVALDPQVKADGAEGAASIAASAANDESFTKIKSLKDLNSLKAEMTKWLTPLAMHCI